MAAPRDQAYCCATSPLGDTDIFLGGMGRISELSWREAALLTPAPCPEGRVETLRDVEPPEV